MKTTKDYAGDVRAAIAAKGMNPSKYRMALELGVNQVTISNWLSGKTMDDENALKVAAYLKRPPAELLLAMAYERASTPESRKLWAKAAKSLAGTALAVLMGCSLMDPNALDITLISRTSADQSIHYAQFGMILSALRTALCLAVLALLAQWTRTCSARSPSPSRI